MVSHRYVFVIYLVKRAILPLIYTPLVFYQLFVSLISETAHATNNKQPLDIYHQIANNKLGL